MAIPPRDFCEDAGIDTPKCLRLSCSDVKSWRCDQELAEAGSEELVSYIVIKQPGKWKNLSSIWWWVCCSWSSPAAYMYWVQDMLHPAVLLLCIFHALEPLAASLGASAPASQGGWMLIHLWGSVCSPVTCPSAWHTCYHSRLTGKMLLIQWLAPEKVLNKSVIFFSLVDLYSLINFIN